MDELTLKTMGYVYNSVSLSLELDLTSAICFVVTATSVNTTVTVNVEGAYNAVTTGTRVL